MLFVDVLSGLLHITLDNPTSMHWPLIGPECEAFQGHHVSPNDITKGTWPAHLMEAHLVHAILALSSLPNFKCRPLRLFLFYSNFSATWMMAAHRWSHTNPVDCPWWVRALMRCGCLITHAHHSRHHITYTEKFALFTGWSNPAINWGVQVVMHAYNPLWVLLFALTMLLPLAVSCCMRSGRHAEKNE